MTHEDRGKYFKKHAQNIEINEDLKNEIIEQAKNKSISCKKAEEIAGELGCSLEENNAGKFQLPSKEEGGLFTQ